MPGDISSEPWTILKILLWTESYFKSFDIDSPRLTAEVLLGHCLRLRRLDLYLQYDRPLQREELAIYKKKIIRRARREPLAYIIGKKDFWKSEFLVTQDVLIPRPDTETLLEVALNILKDKEKQQKVLELGVGSGAVIISIAMSNSDCIYFASDISHKVVQVAVKNSKNNLNNNKIFFFTGSWFSPFKKQAFFDLIVSNPPYIPTSKIKSLEPEIKNYEPYLALNGGKNGLGCIKEIIIKSCNYLKPGGFLLIEIGSDQKQGIKDIVKICSCYGSAQYIKDYAGHYRVVKLKYGI